MKPNIKIFKDIHELSHAAAELFAESSSQAIAERGRFLAALSGGSTPNHLYQLLAGEPYRSQIDWSGVHVFWGDERCVPVDDPGSNYFQARQALLDHVNIPADNIHRVQSDTKPASAAVDYARTLKQFSAPPLEWPRFDLVLLGMGDDGHTASLFPASPIDPAEPVIAVTANYQDRPANRVSLTPRVLNSARRVIFLVTGLGKAVTLTQVLSDISNVDLLPAQRIRPTDGELLWLVDEAAASKS
ncbi:MAG: 6-phosphogluconolactonase [Chloroflexi bacterium]|nr:6-phosphogluconolactonase [Chloroflexota bacterium]